MISDWCGSCFVVGDPQIISLTSYLTGLCNSIGILLMLLVFSFLPYYVAPLVQEGKETVKESLHHRYLHKVLIF